MTVWAETQGHKVNSLCSRGPAFQSCLSGGAGCQVAPSQPPATQTCSQRQPDLLELCGS